MLRRPWFFSAAVGIAVLLVACHGEFNEGVDSPGVPLGSREGAGGSAAIPGISSLKLVRLDGKRLDFSSKPIPLRISIETVFSTPPDAAAIEKEVLLSESTGRVVEGEFSWGGEAKTVMLFTLKGNLVAGATYRFQVPSLGVDQSFTAMIAGDVNGDGFSDVVVGASEASLGALTRVGKIFVYSGQDLKNNNAKIFATVSGVKEKDLFGYNVAIAGDVNADGYADVIVGAINADAAGAAYLFSGATLVNEKKVSDVLVRFTGESPGDEFGTSVSGAGDLNGDGYDDVIVGAPKHAARVGALFCYSGKDPAGGSGKILARIVGEKPNDEFGASVSAAGDVDGDGSPDILAGAPYALERKGAAYLFGGKGLSGDKSVGDALALLPSGANNDEYLDYALSGVGDVTGDGKADVAVGSHGAQNGKGAVFVYSGSSLLEAKGGAKPLVKIDGAAEGDQFGRSLSSVPDIDGDGKAELAVGAEAADKGANGGKAFVYSSKGFAEGKAMILTTVVGAAGNFLGCSVSGAGDVDGDGKGDVLIGARGVSDYTGVAYVYSGRSIPTPSATPLVTLSGEKQMDGFGFSVAGAR